MSSHDGLWLGYGDSGNFHLPLQAQVQTFAYLGIRRSGKTSAATVMAEEFCKHNLPWIALDPVGVWWGLTAGIGANNGFPVVVFGGEHGHLPLSSGKEVADALLSEPVCAVIDLNRSSKTFWRTFLTDFCLRLMETTPKVPRHIFVEEAPEFVPQRTRVDLTARTKEALERLIRLGGNQGYGMSLISQRPATIDKDVLSQCENLFVLRTVGSHDRKALQEWMVSKEVVPSDFPTLAELHSGTGYFWSPQWLEQFTKIRFRERLTFHPGQTREVGARINTPLRLADVGDFVAALRDKLGHGKGTMTDKQARESRLRDPHFPEHPGPSPDKNREQYNSALLTISQHEQRLRELESELVKRAQEARDVARKLEAVKNHLRPQFEALQALFAEIGQTSVNGAIDKSVYDPWLKKAGQAGCRRLLETLLDRPELTKNQLGTLAGIPQNSTFRAYMAWLKRNGLVDVDGDIVRLRSV